MRATDSPEAHAIQHALLREMANDKRQTNCNKGESTIHTTSTFHYI